MNLDQNQSRTLRRRGEAFWRRTMTAQRNSGLSQLEFCRRNDLSHSTFCRWRSRFKNRPSDVDEPATPEFVPVQIRPGPGSEDSSDDFELIFTSGLRLRLPSRVEGRAIAEVLWALEATGIC